MPTHLDAAAAAPWHPVARAALGAALEDGWADPDRLHSAGRVARQLLDAARESVADSLGARPDEVDFASSATQALHAAVAGTLAGNRPRGRRFVHSAVEHSAVLQTAQAHGDAHSVGVDRFARVDPVEFAAAARDAATAALQAVNHEVGTSQPVDEVAALIGGTPLVVDAAQALGHGPVPRSWSVLTADPRTWGAGPGVGLLAVRTGVRWRSPYPPDDRGRLPGAPNLPAIVAAAASLRAVLADQAAEAPRQAALVKRIRTVVAATVPDVEVLGDPHGRAPHIVTFSCLYADGESLLRELDRLGFAVSSGSSCTSSTLEPSHVLVAMGALTGGNVRVSVSRDTTDDDVTLFLDVLPGVVASVRAEVAGW